MKLITKLNTPFALLIGLTLIAGAFFFNDNGRYDFSKHHTEDLFVAHDTSTGEVKLCELSWYRDEFKCWANYKTYLKVKSQLKG